MSAERQQPSTREAAALLKARLAIAWERLPVVWTPPVLALGAVAVAAVWGGFEVLSPPLRAAIVTGVVVAALLLSIANLARLRWPTSEEARRRAGLAVEEGDHLAVGDAELWRLHLAREAGMLRRTQAAEAGAGMARADPMALRYALGVAAALGLWAFGPQVGAVRLAQAFEPVRQAGGEAEIMLAKASATVVGWMTPSGDAPAARVQRASLQSRAQTPPRPRILPAASRP